MIRSALVAFGLFTASMSASAATGFDVGNDFRAVQLHGSVTVSCPSRWGTQSAHFRCIGEVLDPVEFAHFVSDAAVDADAVELKAVHEDGSTRIKAGGYSSAKSKSKDIFNLWIRTLTQRPLLEMGENKIAYTMLKNKKAVMTGTFTANVTDGGDRYCQHDSYWSQNPRDCESGSMVCDRSFQSQNWCE